MKVDALEVDWGSLEPAGFDPAIAAHDCLLEITQDRIIRLGPKIHAAIVASGYVVVPKEATPEMIAAGATGSGEDSTGVALGAWDAMVEAANRR